MKTGVQVCEDNVFVGFSIAVVCVPFSVCVCVCVGGGGHVTD